MEIRSQRALRTERDGQCMSMYMQGDSPQAEPVPPGIR